MPLKNLFNNDWLNSLGRFASTPRCAACDCQTDQAGLCATCLADQARFDLVSWPNLIKRPDIARDFSLPHCDGLFSCMWYQHRVARWHQQYKFGKQTHRLAALQMLLNTQWHAWQASNAAPHFDCMLPIALSKRRYFMRGFNQTEQLWQCQLSTMPQTPALQRIRHTKAQARLSKAKRKANVKHAFEVVGVMTNLRVAIIDDVITTGATIDAAAQACLEAGAASVWAMSLALTPKA